MHRFFLLLFVLFNSFCSLFSSCFFFNSFCFLNTRLKKKVILSLFPQYIYYCKNIGKNLSKNLSGKYTQKLLDRAKQSATDVFKTASKRVIQKTAECNKIDLIGNKIANRVRKCSKSSLQNNSETVTN